MLRFALLPRLCAAIAPLVMTMAGCTYVVVNDELHQPAPCAKVGDCAAGFSCQSDVCTATPDADAPPPLGTPIDKNGGDVTGPDGVVVHIPVGAVAQPIDVVIDTASSTNVPIVTAVSAFYTITPDATLTGAATLSIPVAGDACDAGCHVYQRPNDIGVVWQQLDDGPEALGSATGVLVGLAGVYVAGTAVAP